MVDHDPFDERVFVRDRLRLWRAGLAVDARFTCRDLARLAAGVWLGAGAGALAATRPAVADTPAGPILKPLPPELFTVFGANAEMRWEAMAGEGYLVPVDRFFVRNHTRTPVIDVATWRLQVFGTGLRGTPTAEAPVEFSYGDLRRLPAAS